jgi:hypothetical protein
MNNFEKKNSLCILQLTRWTILIKTLYTTTLLITLINESIHLRFLITDISKVIYKWNKLWVKSISYVVISTVIYQV